MSLTSTGVLPSLRVKAKTVLTAAGVAACGRDHLDQRHPVDRVEEVHAHDPLRMRRLGADLRDRQRRGVGGEDRVLRHVAGQLGEDVLLDLELLDDRLDHQVDAAEAGVVESGLEEGHLAPRLGALQAVPLTCRSNRPAACAMPLARASARTSFMRTGRPGLVRRRAARCRRP